MKRGIFITFEGPEGSGKTTHSRLLCGFLRKKGYKVLHTREPGGTLVSEKIRKILLDPKNKGMDVACEMLLYMAARAQIVKQKILPALTQGKIVVCDRFTDATLAYQGYAGGMDLKAIENIAGIVTKGLKPDITFLLDIDARAGLLRAGRSKDRMERKSILYHNKVRNGYLSIAKKEPKRVKVLSSRGEIHLTQEEIRKSVLKICR
jgi:dTMP kinase